MEFRILGPLEVVEDGQPLTLAAGKQRSLLAILLLHANEVVSADQLIDDLWGEQPPATAVKSLQIQVSQLRKALAVQGAADNAALVTRPPGYELQLEPDALDLHRAERLLAKARDALADGRPDHAGAALRDALALWRGPPLADVAYEHFAQPEIARLEELRLNTLEARIDADLALGRHADLVGELEALVAKHPLREQLRGQLMLALYRSGRQAEALDVYQDTRRLLVDDLGLEPSRELQDLEQGILRHDPALAGPPRAAARETPAAALRRPRTLLVAGAIVLFAAISGLVFELLHTTEAAGLAGLEPNTLGAIDPGTNRIVAQVPVGADPGAVAFAHGSLWVANETDGTLSKVDPKTRRQTRLVTLDATPTGLAADSRSLWVATSKGIELVDPRYAILTRTLPIMGRKASIGYPFPSAPASVAFTGDAAWVTTTTGGLGGRLVRADRRTGAAMQTITTGDNPIALAADEDGVWIADPFDNTVSRVDSTGAVLEVTPVGHGPGGIAVAFGAVWVTEAGDDDVKRIDPETGAVVTTIHVGSRPGGVAVGDGAVWVANEDDDTVSRIDPATNDVVETIHVGSSPHGIAFAQGRMWVTVRAAPVAPTRRTGARGVLRIVGRPGLDPAQWSLNPDADQLHYATCAGLLKYPDKPAPQGAHLVPEIAQALPTVSADGRLYTFALRRGFRFSPPANERVTAATVKATIERTLDPRTKSPALFGGYLDDVVGAQAYEHGRASHVTGVRAQGNRLTIELTRPAGSFPARLSMPFFCPVPIGTPRDTKGLPIPSAGPYYVASASPHGLILRRNPNYGGTRPRHLNEIVYSDSGPPGKWFARAVTGEVDYVPTYVRLPSYAAALERRYGSGTAPGRRRFFVNPINAVDVFALNTRRPLFAHPRLRRAVNYAVDRQALAATGGYFDEGGRLSSATTDQYIPSGMRGFEDVAVYPAPPDVRRARQLAGHVRRHAFLYTYSFPQARQQAEIVKRNLAAIGITVDVRTFAPAVLGSRLGRPDEPYDLALVTIGADYADPYYMLNLLLDGKLARSGKGVDVSQFDNPGYNRKLEAASALSGPARDRAYAQLDAELARDAAPMLAFANETARDFFSARVGCQVYQPVYGIDLGALCIRG